MARQENDGKSIIVFSGDLDKAMAAFIIATGAAAMGSEVTMFFTFWGLNVLRKSGPVAVSKPLLDRVFGWMMPKGPDRLGLSKMNMGGAGAGMMRFIMRKKNVMPLRKLIDEARDLGVRMIACTMSMDVMGLKQEELIDGLEFAGVASYLETAEKCGVNLFI